MLRGPSRRFAASYMAPAGPDQIIKGGPANSGKRRQLAFASLDEVMPDVERLLTGHVTVGRWSLGQICNHLAAALRLTLRGG
jgi:hypothetical protein